MKTYKGFKEIIEALLAGKKLRNTQWSPYEYIYYSENSNEILTETNSYFSFDSNDCKTHREYVEAIEYQESQDLYETMNQNFLDTMAKIKEQEPQQNTVKTFQDNALSIELYNKLGLKLDELSQWIRGVELLAKDAHERITVLEQIEPVQFREQDLQAQADTIEQLEAELKALKEKYSWKSYPENKPKRTGYYLTRSVNSKIDVYLYNKEDEGFMYGGGTIVFFTEIPREGE